MTQTSAAPQPNPQRGEVLAQINGEPQILRLSLGSLAALEAALATPDLMALLARFEAGRPAADDVRHVIAAGFAGAGAPSSAQMVGEMEIEGGVAGAYRLAGALLAAAFGSETSG